MKSKIILSFLFGSAFSVPSSPCPSDNCWEFANNKCTLKPGHGCTSIQCDAKEITIGITEDVLGSENGATGTSPLLSAQTVNSKSGFGKTCLFGECGMAHSIVSVDDGQGGTVEKLQITIDVTQKGNDRTRSLVVDNKKIELGGGITLSTAPFGVGVQFVCLYSLEVEVTSAEFSVKDVTITGATEGVGTLNDGFALTVAPAHGDTIILGSDLTVTTTWEVNLPDLKFYYTSCSVKQGTGDDEKQVAVVKGTCYASVLGTNIVETGEADVIAFGFKSFTIDNAGTGNKQTMTCSVTICKDNCNMATASTICPVTGDDNNYKYTWNGQ